MRIVHCVAAALVNQTGAVLLARRPEGKPMAGYWEFPGGKVEVGESEQLAIIREIEEELSVVMALGDITYLTSVEHAYESFILKMALFGCKRWKGKPHGVEGQAIEWVPIEQIHTYKMPDADPPLIPFIQSYRDQELSGVGS